MVEQGRFCPSARKPEAETAAAGRRKGFLSVRAAAGRNPPFADKNENFRFGYDRRPDDADPFSPAAVRFPAAAENREEKQMPEISVIIPVYNTASFLPACLEVFLTRLLPILR